MITEEYTTNWTLKDGREVEIEAIGKIVKGGWHANMVVALKWEAYSGDDKPIVVEYDDAMKIEVMLNDYFENELYRPD